MAISNYNCRLAAMITYPTKPIVPDIERSLPLKHLDIRIKSIWLPVCKRIAIIYNSTGSASAIIGNVLRYDKPNPVPTCNVLTFCMEQQRLSVKRTKFSKHSNCS